MCSTAAELAVKGERSFIMIKPDGLQRGHVGNVVSRFERRGFKLVAMKLVRGDEEMFKRHYSDLVSKPYYTPLVEYMSSGPVIAMVWEGRDIVKLGRSMLGQTDPSESAPGTVRADLCIGTRKTIIHASDSAASAEREISVWFQANDLISWDNSQHEWTSEKK